MVEMTLTIPDDLAERLRPMAPWLPTILELSLQGFQTPATQTAAEVITFLSGGPTPEQVLEFMVSDHAQARLE